MVRGAVRVKIGRTDAAAPLALQGHRPNAPKVDWFRGATDRKRWRRLIQDTCPATATDEEWARTINAWRPAALPLRGVGIGIDEDEAGPSEEPPSPAESSADGDDEPRVYVPRV